MISRLRNAFIGEFNFKRLLRSVLITPTVFYLIVMISAYSFADSIIFQPQPSFYHDDNSIIKLTTETGEKISAKYFQNLNAEYTILFSYGNAEDIGTATLFLKELQNAGFSVFAYDYRGYGTSEGKPS
ncbi:MAG: alpha/beta hydrolase [Acidobacteria bacterium]|nr:alpha/beta hydrolase [Acidobacteriota bacterium]MCA1640006.1 alpha/beta hydrolase [Acidobacteriota bacterium]